MKRLLLPLALLGFIGGCAAPPPKPPKQPIVMVPSAVCSNPTECERMWVGAQDALQNLTGLRLRMATDTRLETFPPSSRRITAGTVTKYPLGDGRYEIRMRMECHFRDCSDLQSSGENAFNSMMRAYSDRPTR